MPNRVWSHICSFATIDHFGRVSIIEEIDTFYAAQLPARRPTIYIISKWEGYEGEEYDFQVKMSLPEAGPTRSPEYVWVGPRQHCTIGQNFAHIAKVPHLQKINFALASMFSFTFSVFGDYPIEFLINESLIHIMPFHIVEWRS